MSLGSWQKIALPLAMLIFVANARAQSESHARIELIAEQNTAPPGKPLWLGLLFRLDPGWHIYWQNPGDSGEPPKDAMATPAGIRCRLNSLASAYSARNGNGSRLWV